MTPEQTLLEIRKALGTDERLARLLSDYAKHFADSALRKLYGTIEPAFMLRQSGLAEGVEQFTKLITAPPEASSRN